MTTEEKIKVMQAYLDGKQIQILTNQLGWKDEIVREWMNTNEEPTWDWERYEYRIKPEEKNPTYRPYKDTDEMIADFEERFRVNCPPYAMPMIWVKSGDNISLITAYRDNSVCVESVYIQYNCIDLKMLFDMCEYLDGSPCGKLVEE